MVTWLFGLLAIGWFHHSAIVVVVAVAIVFGGAMEIYTGVWEHAAGHTLSSTAFMIYGAFWWTFALIVLFGLWGGTLLIAWLLLLMAVISFYLWLASLWRSLLGMLILLGLWLMFALLAIGTFAGTHSIIALGGFVALIAAALALYASASEIVNRCCGRCVLPQGRRVS